MPNNMKITPRQLDQTILGWLHDAHHRDKCSRRRGGDCDCGKEAIRNALIERLCAVPSRSGPSAWRPHPDVKAARRHVDDVLEAWNINPGIEEIRGAIEEYGDAVARVSGTEEGRDNG